ncbi:probable crossover junction endonuclease EME2 [Brienomyrus brachyistius]|uniref:probable crossover junction endonuclease EME2 n=1 Tax=Brienomyrus brachyistius TaxID=42636 RepID=UPI0020B32EAD|nr:probable crossover junction endonuclease EME2 [Brienomyrus brachyistius]
MSRLKRAKTWEISESEDESDSNFRSLITCDAARKDDIAPSFQFAGENDADQKDVRLEASQASLDADKEDSRCGESLSAPPAAATRTSSPEKRRRRAKQQIEGERVISEQKKEAREKLREERAKQKETKKLEQKQRKEAADRFKSYRPENCLKRMTVCVDPVLLQDEGSDILLGTLRAMEWRSSIEEQQLAHCITWNRELPEGEDGVSIIQEEQILMVLQLNEFMDMLSSIKEILQENIKQVECKSLFNKLSQYLNKYAGKIVTLAVIGLSSWALWEEKRSGGLRDLDLEEALVFLQLSRNTSVIFLESWQDLADHVCAVTKALSKRPMKLLTEVPDLPFCVDGSWASGVRVQKDGTGLLPVWSRQIQQLNRVSPAVAAAISSAFPSPQLLLQAYKDTSEGDQKSVLADLPVTSGERQRRVGPEISSRVYRFLTAHNPQLVLD